MSPGGMVVIGVGNDLRGDDAAGLRVAREVRRRLGSAVRVLELDGEPSRLLDAWAEADVAVVIDASSSSGAAAGSVRRFDAGATPLPVGVGATSTHSLGLADAVELGRALGRLPGRLTVYAIEGRSFGPDAAPTAVLEATVASVAEQVIAEVGH